MDSVGSGFADPAGAVKQLALRERELSSALIFTELCCASKTDFRILGCIVVMTGRDDWISDGTSVLKLSNGNALLAGITASGCIVGTAITTFCGAVNMVAREQSKIPSVDLGNGRLVQGDMLTAAVAG